MKKMIGLVMGYLILLSGVGEVRRIGRDIDLLFRYHVLNVLAKEGFFEYLKVPRSYGQVLAEFGFVDMSYTRTLFEVLRDDVLSYEGNCYQFDSNRVQVDRSLVEKARQNARAFDMMAEGMAAYISLRLRNAPVELSVMFEADDRRLMTKFDETLGTEVFAQLRKAIFALVGSDMKWLRGKKLLEPGCSSGRETIDLWVALKGDVQLTAIDTGEGFLELARRRFDDYLRQTGSINYASARNGSKPVFELASVLELPYEDESFDAVFHAHFLHWTADPKKAIQEIVRVLKPNGLVFGAQPTRPAAQPFFDLCVQMNENAYGFFWAEEFRRWYGDEGIDIKTYSPINMFYGRKELRAVHLEVDKVLE